MFTPLLPFSLPGFVVEHVSTADSLLLVEARASTPKASCPDCHTASAHVHSRYTRHLRDLPVAEHPVWSPLTGPAFPLCHPHVSAPDLCRTPARARPLPRATHGAVDHGGPRP